MHFDIVNDIKLFCDTLFVLCVNVLDICSIFKMILLMF